MAISRNSKLREVLEVPAGTCYGDEDWHAPQVPAGRSAEGISRKNPGRPGQSGKIKT